MKVAYLNENNTDINNDLISRKEFLLFKKNLEVSRFQSKLKECDSRMNIIPKFLIAPGNYLELKSYQMLVRNFLNPNTPYSRLLLLHSTGSGKTIGALSIAMNFLNRYQYQESSSGAEVGSVYIIGFTERIFINELLKYPEFGFISREELSTLNLLKKKSYSGVPADIERLKKFYIVIKKRLYNRKGNGFFKFIGYKELANHLFFFGKEDMALDKDKIRLGSLSQSELIEDIDTGKTKINTELLKEFSNSLIICDEIHNTYNTVEKNNWGLALQIILNYHNSCRSLFLSATPLNNSPTEIIDLLNLLLPRKYYKSLNKQDFFTKNEYIIESKEHEIISYLRGRVSFMQNRSEEFMATKEFKGVAIKGIDYLKFIRCPMTKLHYNTYKDLIKNDIESSIGQDGHYLMDMVLPDFTKKDPYSSKEPGLFRPKDIIEKISGATDAQKSKYGIIYSNDIIKGSILQLKNLANISGKYTEMMHQLLKNIDNHMGKTFIYHNYIHNTGTLFIQEILLQNNIIGEFDNSSESTICYSCGKKRKDHTTYQLNPLASSEDKDKDKKNTHFYQPVRYCIIHGDLDKNTVTRTLEKFNHINNIDGSKIMILIGSRIIKESHSMNSVRNIFITSKPDSISNMIQIIGRAVRLNSHKSLPLNEQHVDIYIFVSSIPHYQDGKDNKNGKERKLSYEEIKYMEKIESFKEIQKLEKMMHRNAIDAYFNYDMIWNGDKSDESNFGLDILPYDLEGVYSKNTLEKHLKVDELNLSTFNAYHAKFEVNYCMYIIKRLFIEISSVWKYNDLLAAVKLPPFNVEIDTKIISQDLFNIALNTLLYNVTGSEYVEPEITNLADSVKFNLMDKLNNPDDKVILFSSVNTSSDIKTKYVLTHVGELYSMVSMHNDELFIDTESIYRTIPKQSINYVDILQFLKTDSSDDYENKRHRFINKWKFTNIIDLEQALCDFGIKFHIKLIEEIVAYVFDIWTKINRKKSENHDFFIKMLHFYDLQKLIAWAHLVDDKLRNRYSKYITPVALELKKKPIKNEKKEITETMGRTNLLISTLNRSDKAWLSTGMVQEYKTNIQATEKLFNNIYKKTTKITKVQADLLPIGHYLDKTPRFYDKDNWFDYVIPAKSKAIKENDIIIGFDLRSRTGMSIKFKLRNPIQNTQSVRDNRTIEHGTVCSSKSKSFLRNVAKRLEIISEDSLSVDELCAKIRNRLIYLELKEYDKPNRKKYFYSVLEDSEIA